MRISIYIIFFIGISFLYANNQRKSIHQLQSEENKFNKEANNHLDSSCDGILLTDATSIATQTKRITTNTSFGGSIVYLIDDEQYIDLRDTDCLRLGEKDTDFSLSMWLKLSGNEINFKQGEGSQIIGNQSQYSQKDQGFILKTKKPSDGKLQLTFQTSNPNKPNSDRNKNISSVIDAEIWNHIVVTYLNDGTNSKATIYVNNIASSGEAHPNIYSQPLRIGDRGWGQILPFEISELKSYGRILSEEEIESLFLDKASDAFLKSGCSFIRGIINKYFMLTIKFFTNLFNN